jgi:hypothetical protein
MGGGEILRFHWAERAIAAALLYCRLLYGRMSVISRSSHVITCMCWAGLGGEGLLDSGFWAAPAAVERARSIERRPAPQAQACRPACSLQAALPPPSEHEAHNENGTTYVHKRPCLCPCTPCSPVLSGIAARRQARQRKTSPWATYPQAAATTPERRRHLSRTRLSTRHPPHPRRRRALRPHLAQAAAARGRRMMAP